MAQDDEKRLNVKLSGDKHEQFRRACMRNERTMSEEVEKFIDRYLISNPIPPAKPR